MNTPLLLAIQAAVAAAAGGVVALEAFAPEVVAVIVFVLAVVNAALGAYLAAVSEAVRSMTGTMLQSDFMRKRNDD